MTRDRGIELVSNYDDACSDEYIASFCEYIDISVGQFWTQVHQSVNRELFDVDANGKITRKFQVGVGL
jgi:hypothetical protein